MRAYNISEVQRGLETLIDKSITKISKIKDELILVFGESPAYYLQIGTQFRFVLMQDIILGEQDIFLPSFDESTKVNFKKSAFNWEADETRFDERMERFFNEGLLGDYVVKEVKAGDYGDFTLIFTNAARLEVKSDTYGNSNSDEAKELWRLSDGTDNIISVTSIGIADPEDIGGEQGD